MKRTVPALPDALPQGLPTPMARWSRELEAGLETEVLGLPILAYASLESTNDLVKELAARDAPEGLTVVARHQTRGRGQLGRTWYSPAGMGVYASVLLKPRLPGLQVKWMPMLAVVAAARALEQVGVGELSVKWPNDILARGRKIAGVLVEPRLGQKDVSFAVLGLGLNVRQAPGDWPPELASIATSCAQEGVETDCDAVLLRFLTHLDHAYGRVRERGPGVLTDAWQALLPGEAESAP